MSAIPFGTSTKAYTYSERGDRHIVRTASGTVYVAIMNYTDGKLEMWKATGGAFTKVGADPTCYSLGSCAAAIGSGSPQFIHVLFYSNSTTVKYVTFNTSTDTWGTAETVVTTTAPSTYACAIALDSANVPHVVYYAKPGATNDLMYCNRLTGVWQTPVAIENAKNTRVPSIAIDTASGGNHRTDIPQIAYIQSTDSYLQAALGNVNNATAFTVVRPATKSAAAGFTSIAVDSNGRTVLAYDYPGVGAYTQVVYLDGNAAWGTAGNWANEANITGDANGISGGLFISGTTRYLVTQNSTTGIRYQVSVNYGAWSAPITLNAGTYSFPSVRNQYANDPKGSLDYLYRDSSNYLYFNTLALMSNTNNTGLVLWFF